MSLVYTSLLQNRTCPERSATQTCPRTSGCVNGRRICCLPVRRRRSRGRAPGPRRRLRRSPALGSAARGGGAAAFAARRPLRRQGSTRGAWGACYHLAMRAATKCRLPSRLPGDAVEAAAPFSSRFCMRSAASPAHFFGGGRHLADTRAARTRTEASEGVPQDISQERVPRHYWKATRKPQSSAGAKQAGSAPTRDAPARQPTE